MNDHRDRGQQIDGKLSVRYGNRRREHLAWQHGPPPELKSEWQTVNRL